MIFMDTMGTAILTIVNSLLSAYVFVVLARCVLSWFNPSPFNPIVRAIYAITEPVLWRIRKHLPFSYSSGVDFSPIILIIGIYLVRQFLHAIFLQFFAHGGL